MLDKEIKALQAKEKAEVTSSAEQTSPGLVFKPAVDFFETDKELTMLADIPGVRTDDLNIDLYENVLTLDGYVKPPEDTSEVDLFREYRTGKYYRQFTLPQVINQEKIKAELKDGVLRLNLPKVEEAKPRKITVKTS